MYVGAAARGDTRDVEVETASDRAFTLQGTKEPSGQVVKPFPSGTSRRWHVAPVPEDTPRIPRGYPEDTLRILGLFGPNAPLPQHVEMGPASSRDS
jgi:hypothetical protein